MSNHTGSVIVRPAETRDAVELRENCFSANTLAEVESQIADAVRARQERTRILFVAEVDGVVVGTGTLVRDTHPLSAHCGELAGLVVHPDYQRRGIARRITETVRDYAVSMGLEILKVGCRGGEPAELVYPRLGFIECGRLPRGLKEPWGEGRTFDEVSFYLPLTGDH